jgi:mRNA interferase YafQ
MRTIERTTAFKRDYKREKRGQHSRTLDKALGDVVQLLADDEPLPPRNRDHPLSGDWSGYRECHIKPDLLLIYSKPEGTLQLIRLGSHSELFK